MLIRYPRTVKALLHHNEFSGRSVNELQKMKNLEFTHIRHKTPRM